MLAYLAITGRGHHRETLGELFWPEMEESRSRGNLRRNLSELKSILAGEALEIDRETVYIGQSGSIWVDVLHFREIIRECKAHDKSDAGPHTSYLSSLSEASDLYRDDFLAGFYLDGCREFEQWVIEEREDLRNALEWALQILTVGYKSLHILDAAIRHAKRWWNLDRYDELPCRQLMWLYAQTDRRPAALRVYELLVDDLREIDAVPEAETDALYREILGSTRRRNPPPVDLQPFVAGPPITDPRHFFGREEVLRRLFGLWRSLPLQNAAIIGPRRSGKTSLLHYLSAITQTPSEQLRPGQRIDWLPQPRQYRWIFVDFQDPNLQSRAGLIRFLLDALDIPAAGVDTLGQFTEVVRQTLHVPTIILLDEIGSVLRAGSDLDNTFWEALRALACNQVEGRLAFVLSTGKPLHELIRGSHLSSPFFNIFGYTTRLRPFSEAEARELISYSPVEFPPEDTEWILEHSGKWPCLLQILCRERLASLEAQDTGIDWQAEGMLQMAPWLYLLEQS